MRIVAEHPDGRRVGLDEEDFEDQSKNPFNAARTIVSIDAGRNGQTTEKHPGRALGEHVSLKEEGFKVVAALHPETGHEMPLEGAPK